MRKKKDTNGIVIRKMIGYCVDIENTMERFNNSFDMYISDITFRYSCDMCVLQIGELTNRLTEEFKNQHPEIVWHEIKAMRNIHVHDYENVQYDVMWETLTQDIPILKEKLTKIFDEMNEK